MLQSPAHHSVPQATKMLPGTSYNVIMGWIGSIRCFEMWQLIKKKKKTKTMYLLLLALLLVLVLLLDEAPVRIAVHFVFFP